MLGLQNSKSTKTRVNVIENISKEFSTFWKLRQCEFCATRREITIFFVAPRTSRYQMVTTMSKFLHVLRKKHSISILNLGSG